jgi:hypothetical protein
MKRVTLFSLLCFSAASAIAQFKLDMVLNATPPANISEWANRREILTAIVTGQPGLPPANAKIKAEIKTTDGTVIGTTDLARSGIFVVSSSAPTIFTATEVLPVEFIVFTGKYRSSMEKTGKLPSDNYTLCVQLVRPADYTPLSQPVTCKNFYLAATQLPTLMKPYDGEVLDAHIAQTAITFRWTPALPRTTTPATYRLQVFEVLEKQSPVQALRSNQPLLDQQVMGTTQYIWRPQLSFIWIQPGDLDGDGTFDDGKMVKPKGTGNKNPVAKDDGLHEGDWHVYTGSMLIWTIQTLDDHGLPITQNDGSGEARSEPIVFYVKMKAKEKGNR